MLGKRKNKINKAISLVLSFALLSNIFVNIFVYIPLYANAAGNSSASQSQRFMYDDAVLYMDKNIADNGNGYYTLTVDAAAYLKKSDVPSDIMSARDGAIEIQHDGYYLIELWGGNGASGSDSLQSEGGAGGSGGHVYGIIHLTKGQTLVYTIGTNGQPIPGLNVNAGGGENEGGDKEGISTYATGGGGGYSAVYLFDGSHSSTITEQERINKYIMIAGGGGGGGAGNDWAVEATGTSDGGHGGVISSLRTGNLTAQQNNGVAGTWFGGANGSSSGTSVKHVGRGGTNYIGESALTGLILDSELFSFLGTDPNDWIGTYSYQATDTDGNGNYVYNNVPAGHGGAGFLRGGAGGAGFCGGSGGTQDSVVFASSIGGGGGGSSFVSDKLIVKTNSTGDVVGDGIPDYNDYAEYIEGFQQNPNGGKINITYIGETKIDQTKYETINFNLQISQYFDVVSVTAKNTDGSNNGDISRSLIGEVTDKNSTTTNINISGADISPDEEGFWSDVLTVTVLLRAKTDFAGGNNVPVFAEGTEPKIYPQSNTGDVSVMSENAATDYVNVPLNFKAIANSYASADTTKSYPVSSLYTDNYALVRNSLANYWQYDFISSMTAYSVSGSYITNGVAQPTSVGTHNYTVSFTVTPVTTTLASVGASVSAKTFSATATITILHADSFQYRATDPGNELGVDINISSGKSLSYNSSKGFSLGLDSNISFEDNTAGVSQNGNMYTIQESGWYFIEAFGGAGGGSGKAQIKGKNGTLSASGSGGGSSTGGYTGAYIHLTAGTEIRIELGTKGSTSSNSTGQLSTSNTSMTKVTAGGGGGTNTKIYINDVLVMSAGGGGGASGAGAAARQNALILRTADEDGVTGYSGSTSYVVTGSASNADTNGRNGGSGTASVDSSWLVGNISAGTGARGTAATNYISDVFFNTDSNGNAAPATIQANYRTYTTLVPTASSDGKAAVTLIMTDASVNAAEKLAQGYAVSGAISRYFDVNDIEMNFDSSVGVSTSEADGWTTKTYTSTTANVVLGHFTYRLTEKSNTDGEPCTVYEIKDVLSPIATTSTTISAKPSFTLKITPKNGFIGGYDVPLVESGLLTLDSGISYESNSTGETTENGVAVTYKDKGMLLLARNETDFANVPLNYTFYDENFDVVLEKTVTCGEEVDQAGLITVNKIPLPTGEDAWKAEFVEAVYPTTVTDSPTANKLYSFTQTVCPKPREGEGKAKVTETIESVTFTKSTNIYVNYTIDASGLVNIEYSGPTLVADGETLSATLTADMGYDLPSTITVKRGGSTLSSSYYTYDKATGKFTISAGNLTNNITISGKAVEKTYTLYYYIADKPADGDEEVEYKIYKEENHKSGDMIDSDWTNSFTPEASYEGYHFQWDWATENNLPLTEMPAYDYAVWGTYVKNQYTLTINYYKDGVLDDTHTEKFYYGDTYSVVSPNIPGYKADKIIVSGQMGADNVNVDVNYTAAPNELHIYYIYADTNTEAYTTHTEKVDTNGTYSVNSPEIQGYTADMLTVSGTMTADGATYYVYYNPNKYTVTFNAGDGKITSDSSTVTKTVLYHNIYGYDPMAEEGSRYSELPIAYKDGYDFVGWYLDEGFTQKADEETRVETANNHTLYAKFEAHKFLLTIIYQYTDGISHIDRYEHVTGEVYSHSENLYYEGYTPYIGSEEITAITGTMGLSNVVVTVNYYINSRTVTLNLYIPDGNGGYTLYSTPQTLTDEYGTSYSFTVNNLEDEGYRYDRYEFDGDAAEKVEPGPEFTVPTKESDGSISGVLGITENRVLDIYYEFIDYTLTISYVYENGDSVAEQYTGTYHVGQAVPEIVSPVVQDYHADHLTLGGEDVQFPAYDVEITVIYSIDTYTLTIYYVYSDLVTDTEKQGQTAATTVTEKLPVHTPYSKTSPEIEGYYADNLLVSGTLESDATYTITYFDAEVVSVTVEINDIQFDFASAVWDPETHTYKTPDGNLAPKNDNSIKITNEEGSIPVTASVSYSGDESNNYTLNAKFTATNDAAASEANTSDLPLNSGDSTTLYLWLSGDINVDKVFKENGVVKIGTVTVTIGKAGDE